MRQAAVDLVEIHTILGFDPIRLYPTPRAERPIRIGRHTWQEGQVGHEQLPSDCQRPWTLGCPERSEAEREDALRQALQRDPPPLTEPDNRCFLMWREARRLTDEKGIDLPVFAAVYSFGVSTQPPFLLRWFVSDRALVHEYYARQRNAGTNLAVHLAQEGADIRGLGGDFASDHGPMCSPRDYREFIAPNVAMQAEAMRRRGVLTTNASNGDIWPVIDAFLLDASVDGFEEIDFAAGMDLGRLRAQYPATTFIGNLDIRHTLTGETSGQSGCTRAVVFRTALAMGGTS